MKFEELHGCQRMPTVREFGKRGLSVVLSFLIWTPAFAQQSDKRPASREEVPATRQTGMPELTAQNLDRVSASAAQIEEVLRKDPGLLVELKRWVAKEASDSGQVVEDAELADSAIFDRLTRDVPFRSVATRLLQRYGHLMPTISPDSEVAKMRVSECDPLHDADCGEQLAPTPRRKIRAPADRPRPEMNPPSGPESLPSTPGTNTLQTGNVRQEPDLRERLNPQAGLEMASGPAKRTPEGIPQSGGLESLPSMGNLPASAERTRDETPLRPGAGTENVASSRTERLAGTAEEEVNPVAMVHRPNPYADIPSLYDLNVQAASRQHPLERFGLDVFQNGTREPGAIPMDLPVGPDYVVGPGDGLAIDLWGGVSQRLFRIVDREGRLSLPETGPLLVSGRSLSEVQRSVQQALRTQFRDVSADVSLSRLRTVRVYVVGDVAEPGAYDISSLSTPLNALFAAGGVTGRGSLRALKHYRGKQLVQEVDAYDLLLHGLRSDLKRLENGDSLLVPPIGPQVTVDGMVRRPAIYELNGERTLEDVFELAGGILPAAALRHIEVQRLEAHQKRTMLTLDLSAVNDVAENSKTLSSFVVREGDEVHVFPIAPYNEETVYLRGHVLRPGRYSFHPGMTLTDLIASYSDLLPEPSPHYAEIVRLALPDHHPSVESFDLSAALSNPGAAPKLEPLDTVRIFSRYEFEPAPVVGVGGEVRAPGQYRTSGQTHLRDAIYLAGGVTQDAYMDSAQLFRAMPDGTLKILSVNLGEVLSGNPVDNILLQPRDRILIHRIPARVDPPTVYVKGEVVKPGRYPLSANLHVADLIRVAGGFKRSAYIESGDLTRYLAQGKFRDVGEHVEIQISAALAGDPNSNISMLDGDVLTIKQLPGWNDIGASVSIRGEVQHAGVYGIRPGDRLSSVLRRAEGFLPSAYPQGIVFERIEVRRLQEKGRQELIQRIQLEAGSFKSSLQQTSQEQVALQQTAIEQRKREVEALQQAPVTGRIVLRLGSDLSRFEHSPNNIELRDGDTIYIPKRPSFVLVTGQVYNSDAITFIPGKDTGWYLKQAGGATDQANKKAIFVVRANGSVVSGEGLWWSGGVSSTRIEPGDVIVVPEKAIGGGTFWKNLIAVAQIAEAGALVATIALR